MTDNSIVVPSTSGAASGQLAHLGSTPLVARNPYGAQGDYGAAPSASLADTLLLYWRIFYKRKWLILGVAATFLTFSIVRTLMETPLYTATVRIQIDRTAAKVVEGGNINPSENADTDFLRTQYELLQSRTLSERVVSLLKLDEDGDFMKPRSFSIVDAAHNFLVPTKSDVVVERSKREQIATKRIMESRVVRPVPGSRLVDILCTDPSPIRAQRIANAYGESFISSNIDKRFEANSYAKTFLEDQAQQLKLRLEESEKQMLAFAEREQIVIVNEKASVAENNLAAANAALGSLISERIKNEQLWRQVERTAAVDLPQFLLNGVIVNLRAQKNTLVADYQERLQNFKPGYPTMVETSNKIKEIDRQIASEIKSIRASLKGAYGSSLQQEEATKQQIERLRQDVLDLQKRSLQYDTLKREVDSNRGLYNSLLQRFKEVDIAGGVGTNNVFVVDKAVLPYTPSSPNFVQAFLLALALGLGAGIGGAYVLESLDDTLRTVEDIQRVSGLVTLGVIPTVGPAKSTEVEIEDTSSALSEAYRSLCTSLQFATDKGLPKTLLVTSSGPSEGKSLTAFAIARHFAILGLKVLVVDSDLRKPSLHQKLGLENISGLTNYLTGRCTPPEVIQATSIPNLAFISAGPLPPNAAELLGSARLTSLLTIGLDVFDLIVVDSPPVLGLADALLLSSATAATIFVVSAGQSRTGSVRNSLQRLELARAPVIGAVLTKYDARAEGYGYGYGYGSGYGYGYGRTPYTYGQSAATSLPKPDTIPPDKVA